MKNKQHLKSSFFQNNKYIFLSGGCALLIMGLIFYCYNLLPFGNMTILRMDLYHQYGPLFAELYDRLTSGESLLYSWESGLGGSFLGNFFNYLSSPLSFIVLFFGHKNITEAISVMILLKAVFSSITFSYYLKTSTKRNDPSIAAFGILYAFCGYFVAYYWNLMWIDAMYLFPLVILGIEKIIKEGKPLLYSVSLAVMFVANYYMAYMVCIFSVLYFLTFYFGHFNIDTKFDNNLKSEDGKKISVWKKMKNSLFLSSGFQFAFFSVISVLLVAVCILPLMEVLSGSSATNGTNPSEMKKYFTVFDFLANHIAYSSPTIRSSGSVVLPNVYCGIITLILVPLYLYCDKISTREKVANVLLLGVLYFSFNINFLNYFWHGFHFPNDLPYRFSFMYSFVLLQMAYQALIHVKSFSGKQIFTVGLAFVAFLIFVEKFTSKNITDVSLLITLLFSVAYVLILHLFKNPKFTASALSFLVMCTVLSEVALSNTNQYVMNQNKTNYTSDYDAFRALKQKLDEQDDSPFYRMELTDMRTRMDPCWYNYHGVSVFSSMASEKVANLQSKLGLDGNVINSYTYHMQTPIYNAMFGLKYIVNNNETPMSSGIYTPLFTSDKFNAYQNDFALPIAFGTDQALKDWSVADETNPFEAQNQWFQNATGIKNVLKRIPIDDIVCSNMPNFLPKDIDSGNLTFVKENEKADASFTAYFEVPYTANVYIYINSNKTDEAEINGNMLSQTVKTHDGFILDLGKRNAKDIFSAYVPVKKDETKGSVKLYAYMLDEAAFREGYQKLQENALNITEFQDTKIVGTVKMDADQILYTSIPFDKNWEIKVDGQELYEENIFKISDALLGLKIGPGEHEIEFHYVSKGLWLGLIISGITGLYIVFYAIISKKRHKKHNKWASFLSAPAVSKDDMISEYLDMDIVIEDQKNKNK